MKPPFAFLAGLLCIASFSAKAQFTNVKITSAPVYLGETSIAIDPNNLSRLVGGNNYFEMYHSSDTGKTWTQKTVTSTLSNGGDVAVAADNLGNFFSFHLALGGDKLVCQRSINGGQTWNNGVQVGYNPGKFQDKEWGTCDRTNGPYKNNVYMVWTELDKYNSNLSTDSSMILLSRSSDTGSTWSVPVQVSKKKANCGWKAIKGACPAIGPNGEVYVSWCGQGVRMNKSLNAGNTWMSSDVQVDVQVPDWYFTIPNSFTGNGFTSMACDISNGPYKGNVYIAWADQRNGTNNTDVFVAKSVNGGTTWTTSMVNNDFTGTHQFHPYLTIDQTTGYIYVLFYDRRNFGGGSSGTDTYLAWSTDGGLTYKNIKVNIIASTVGAASGDYINITAHNNIIRPIWTHRTSSALEDYTALIDYNSLVIAAAIQENALVEPHPELDQNYPNPFSESCILTFTMPEEDNVNLSIYNSLGQEVARPIDGIHYEKGTWQLVFYPEKYGLPPGIYHYSLLTSKGCETKRMVFSN